MTKLKMENRCIALLLMCWILFSCRLAAQSEENGKTVTLNLKNATLSEFVKQMESVSSYSFVFGEDVKLARKINLDARDKTVREILDKVFWSETVTYQITGKHILLQPRPALKPSVRKYTISGYVSDSISSETLIGANIVDMNGRYGTATNPFGFYSFTVPEGEVQLYFSYLGYAPKKQTVNLSKDTVMNVQLNADNQLAEVVVVSKRAESGLLATQMGANEITMEQVESTPVMLGEADIMKTIQLMPGIQSGVEGSAGLHVRGGGPDQNLILLDGVPVYNVDHLLGFFSVFTPEAVKKVTLFKSSFPARFGGRLSSVIDVRINDGDMKKYHGTVSIGLLSSKLHLEGPIIKDRTSFNISARRSYADFLIKPFLTDGDKFAYYFYDVNAKVNHKFSDRSRLFVNFYNGKDKFYFTFNDGSDSNDDAFYHYRDEMSIGWGNTIASMRWNYIFNNKLFGNATVSYNKYKMFYEIKNDDEGDSYHTTYSSDYRSGIRDYGGKMDFEYTPVPTHHIKFGGEYLYHNFRPEVTTSQIKDLNHNGIMQDTIYGSDGNSQIYAHEASAYLEDNYDITPTLSVNAGIHLSMFHVQKKNYFSGQPRVSVRYQMTDDWALKSSYTKMNQYVHLLTSMPISLPTDLWVPVTGKIKPMRAHQYSLGVYNSGLEGWEFSIESYYKDMRNVLEYKDGVSFFGSSQGWEDKVEMGHGRSMGIEFMAQKTMGKTKGWLSYTLAKSERKFAKGGISDGEWFPYKYDRRHTINLSATHKFSDRFDIGATWTFASGNTMTVPMGSTAVILPEWGNFIFISNSDEKTGYVTEAGYIAHRNNYRLPSTHRLNLGVNFHKKKKYGIRTINISLYNAYNSMNPNFVYKDYDNNQGKEVLRKLTILPCIPSITYTYKF